MSTAKFVDCLRTDFPSLTVYQTLQCGGGDMIVVSIPNTSVVIKVVRSPNRLNRYDLFSVDGDSLHRELEPTEITPMVRLTLRCLSEV